MSKLGVLVSGSEVTEGILSKDSYDKQSGKFLKSGLTVYKGVDNKLYIRPELTGGHVNTVTPKVVSGTELSHAMGWSE